MWSLIGFWAAVSLTMTEEFGLLMAGVVGFLLIALRNRNTAGAVASS